MSARLLAAKRIRPTYRVAGPGLVRLVGFDPSHRRLVAVAVAVSRTEALPRLTFLWPEPWGLLRCWITQGHHVASIGHL
jgi:hypothetical protein